MTFCILASTTHPQASTVANPKFRLPVAVPFLQCFLVPADALQSASSAQLWSMAADSIPIIEVLPSGLTLSIFLQIRLFMGSKIATAEALCRSWQEAHASLLALLLSLRFFRKSEFSNASAPLSSTS